MKPARKMMIALFLIPLAFTLMGMGQRDSQYDEEARELEKYEKEARQAGELPAEETQITEEEAEDVKEKSALRSARDTGKDAANKTLKGAVKVATFGYGKPEDIQVEEPEKDSGEPTKFKIRF